MFMFLGVGPIIVMISNTRIFLKRKDTTVAAPRANLLEQYLHARNFCTLLKSCVHKIHTTSKNTRKIE